MKQFLMSFLTITLILFGSTKVRAQNDCPDIEWMRFFNNDKNFNCSIYSIDSIDNEIVIGKYEGSLVFGSFNLPNTLSFSNNYFIAKMDSAGNPLWVQVAERNSNSNIFFSLSPPVTDDWGNIYLTLKFTGSVGFGGTVYSTGLQQNNTLLIKMNAQGQIQWTHLFEDVLFNLIYIDQNSNFYCNSDFTGTVSIDGTAFTSNGGSDILVFGLDAQFHLLWAKQIGGNQNENSYNDDIANTISAKVDSQNNIYLAGTFQSSTLNIGNIQLNNPANAKNVFILKIDSNGNFIWANQIGIATYNSFCFTDGLVLDNDNNIYVALRLNGTLNLNNSAITSFPVGAYNSLLIKYDQNLQQVQSYLLFSGGWNAIRNLMYLSHKDMVVLSGVFDSTVDFYIDSLTANNGDFYVAGIAPTSASESLITQWLVRSHGNGGELWPVLAKDFDDNIYLSGTYSDDLGAGAFGNYTFPAIPGNNNNVSNGYQAKLSFLSREVTDSNGVLSAVQDSAIYQWLDCDNAMQPVAGATSQSFQPPQPGSYAVQVSNSFCSVVSECISTTGISESQRLRQTEVYPNPVQETLHLGHLPLGTQVSVFDVLGRAVYSTIAKNTKLDISTRLWSPGLYMLRLSKDGAVHLEKVVKE